MSKIRPPKHLRPATERWRQVANSWELEEHHLRRCAPHQPNPSVTRWHHCVRCETEATEIAMRLVPFTREMHARLASGLKSYRQSTPALASEKQRLDQLAGTIAWRRDRLAVAQLQASGASS